MFFITQLSSEVIALQVFSHRMNFCLFPAGDWLWRGTQWKRKAYRRQNFIIKPILHEIGLFRYFFEYFSVKNVRKYVKNTIFYLLLMH
jgi:hypothetical protein